MKKYFLSLCIIATLTMNHAWSMNASKKKNSPRILIGKLFPIPGQKFEVECPIHECNQTMWTEERSLSQVKESYKKHLMKVHKHTGGEADKKTDPQFEKLAKEIIANNHYNPSKYKTTPKGKRKLPTGNNAYTPKQFPTNNPDEQALSKKKKTAKNQIQEPDTQEWLPNDNSSESEKDEWSENTN